MSKKYQLKKEDGSKILKALAFSLASSIIAFLIALIPSLDIPAEYVFLVPVVNGALYTAKRFFDGEK
jgi:uncharacterized protein involved in cysteine biosynthesis